ncbi:MAG: phosphomannomutase/phosphoglucomutase [Candidatus Pacebacteria bacterium RIFCSPHIGHO2_01_FULL_46_10]|nr:MAG: phosphomannomutase/phosphoglucomutase [Candidatus Pacebacteria bacterium RIFCSPHIGHO2_01_FULL_46_10]
MTVHPGIFKSYDIRGVYGKEIFDETGVAVGKAFAKVLQPKTVIVGRDARISSPALHDALIQGLTSVGVNIIDVGMVSTDMYYFACATKKLPGIMITASHNPKEYNGFKMVRQIPYLLSGDEGIQDIKKLIEDDTFPPIAKTPGKVETWQVMPEFIQKMLSLVDTAKLKPMKILCDTANGMVGPTLTELLKHIPQIKMVPMYFDPDGTFPNHAGDPLMAENRKELQERVPKEHADLGFAFDPDGDRFFCIDKTGRFVSGDFMTALLAQYFLKKSPGSAIIYDIRSSHAVPDLIKKAGGKALYERVGHAYIKKRMKNENAIFGGEVTGHYYFADFFYCDSGVAPMLFLMDLLSGSTQTLDQMLDELEKTYFISGEINTKGVDAKAVFEQIEKIYAPQAKEIIRIDGITMKMGDWHFNVRASNTEPLVRLNVEATSAKLMEQKRDEVLAVIRKQ